MSSLTEVLKVSKFSPRIVSQKTLLSRFGAASCQFLAAKEPRLEQGQRQNNGYANVLHLIPAGFYLNGGDTGRKFVKAAVLYLP